MNRDQIIELAKEAGCIDYITHGNQDRTFAFCTKQIERFAAMIEKEEHERVAKWMMAQGYATGHGDTIEDLLTELEWQMKVKK